MLSVRRTAASFSFRPSSSSRAVGLLLGNRMVGAFRQSTGSAVPVSSACGAIPKVGLTMRIDGSLRSGLSSARSRAFCKRGLGGIAAVLNGEAQGVDGAGAGVAGGEQVGKV